MFTRSIVVEQQCATNRLQRAFINKLPAIGKHSALMPTDRQYVEEHKLGCEKLFLQPKFLALLTRDSNEFERYPV